MGLGHKEKGTLIEGLTFGNISGQDGTVKLFSVYFGHFLRETICPDAD